MTDSSAFGSFILSFIIFFCQFNIYFYNESQRRSSSLTHTADGGCLKRHVFVFKQTAPLAPRGLCYAVFTSHVTSRTLHEAPGEVFKLTGMLFAGNFDSVPCREYCSIRRSDTLPVHLFEFTHTF